MAPPTPGPQPYPYAPPKSSLDLLREQMHPLLLQNPATAARAQHRLQLQRQITEWSNHIQEALRTADELRKEKQAFEKELRALNDELEPIGFELLEHTL